MIIYICLDIIQVRAVKQIYINRGSLRRFIPLKNVCAAFIYTYIVICVRQIVIVPRATACGFIFFSKKCLDPSAGVSTREQRGEGKFDDIIPPSRVHEHTANGTATDRNDYYTIAH